MDYIPLRESVNNLGGSISWDGVSRTATVNYINGKGSIKYTDRVGTPFIDNANGKMYVWDNAFYQDYYTNYDDSNDSATVEYWEQVGVVTALLTPGIKVSGFGSPTMVTPLGRGTTGRTLSNNLNKQIAMKEAMSNPLENATQLPIEMKDSRWLGTDGWVKMQKIITTTKGKITIHFNYNSSIRAFDEFKFK